VICDKKALEDYIANPLEKMNQEDRLEYKECEQNALIIGWIILIPRMLWQSYIILEYRKVRNNIN
jgi:hypothetical protein